MSSAPDTIVLVHGFWVTPRSWEDWIAHYERRGYRVLAPAYPGFEVEVEALNADPSPIEAVTVPADHRAPRGGRRRARRAADPDGPLGRRRLHPDPARPRLRRRRRGDQLGAHRGRHASCRSRRSRRPSRCSRTRPTATRPSASPSSSGTTRSPTPSARSESRELYERYHIPASGCDLLGQRARQHPPRQGRHLRQLPQRRPRAAAVHLGQRGPPHAAEDPASNAKHYKSDTVTEVKEFEGPHLLPAQDGLGGGRRLRAGLGGRATRRRRRRPTA